MTKECINCKDDKRYQDNEIKCTICGNYLKIVDYEDSTKKRSEDPYQNFFVMDVDVENNINKKKEKLNDNEKVKKIIEDPFMEMSSNNDSKKHKSKDHSKEKIREKTNTATPIIEGVVRNYREHEAKSFMIVKVFRTLRHWMNYAPTNYVNSFQVYKGWGTSSNEVDHGDEIVLFGKLAMSSIANNNEVMVYGKRNKNGTIVAKKVFNKTTGSYIKVNNSISPYIILGLVLMILRFIVWILTYDWMGALITAAAFILSTLMFIIVIYIIIKATFRR